MPPLLEDVEGQRRRAIVDYEPDAILAAKSAKPSQTLAASANISYMEFAHVKLSGDRAGEYVVTEERPDGSLTLVPDTSFDAIRKRLGTEPGTLADFEAEYGPVQPPDGEG